jgi:putative transposon-encoded protein
MDILNVMRQIQLSTKKLNLNENVEVFYEKRITPFGNSAKIDAPKKYIGKRAYVVIVKD